MNAEQKQHFIKEAKNTPEAYLEKGLISIGKGSLDLSYLFKGCITVLDFDFSRPFDYMGNAHNLLYATKKRKWESVMEMSFESIFEEKEKAMNYQEIQKEQVEAFDLIGKTIYYKDNYSSGKVHSVFPIFSENDFLKLPGIKVSFSDFTKNCLKEKGFVILLRLNDTKGSMSDYISFNNPAYSLEEPITVETTKHLKYTGKPNFDEKVWVFGCAKVSFDTIDNISETKEIVGCKSIQSVQIGNGIFPIETIKKMAEIQKKS